MSDRAGGMDERDVDERFASIISQWDSPLPVLDDLEAPRSEPSPSESAASEAAPSEVAEPDAAPEDSSPPDPAPPEMVCADATGTTEGPVPQDDPRPVADRPDDASDTASPVRPSWVNPSPLGVAVPPAAWRAAEPTPAGDAKGSTGRGDPAEEHFEPPAVALPPQEDLHFWGAVIGLVAGPLMLLYVAMARPFHSTRWFIASVVVSVAGFALLVLRQPTHRDPTSGDDGARI